MIKSIMNELISLEAVYPNELIKFGIKSIEKYNKKHRGFKKVNYEIYLQICYNDFNEPNLTVIKFETFDKSLKIFEILTRATVTYCSEETISSYLKLRHWLLSLDKKYWKILESL